MGSGLEGFEPLGPELPFLDLYHKLGLRIASLTHTRRNLYADGAPLGSVSGARRGGGLTALGRHAVRPMNELGIVSLPRDRECLEAIAPNGGVLGMIFFQKETLDDVIADMETALEAMGPDHVGL